MTGRKSYAYAVARAFDPADPRRAFGGCDGAEVRLDPGTGDLVAVVSAVPPRMTSTRRRCGPSWRGWTAGGGGPRPSRRGGRGRRQRRHRCRSGWPPSTRRRAGGRGHAAGRTGIRAGSTGWPDASSWASRSTRTRRAASAGGCSRRPPARAGSTCADAGTQHRRARTPGQRAGAAAERVDAALAELAVDRRHHRPQPAQLSGAAGENVLNAAYLVQTRALEEFAALARALDARTRRHADRGHRTLGAYSFTWPSPIRPSAQ